MPPEEWNALLRACQDGENPDKVRVARGRLYSLYCNRVYRYFLKCGNDEQLALDLMQKTFERVLGRLNHFSGSQSQFERYLFKAAKNVWLQRKVAGSIGKLVDFFMDLLPAKEPDIPIPDSGGAGNHPDPGKSVEARLIEQELVRRALAEVTEPYLTPFRLCDEEGHSYEEIAKILDLPLGTAKSRIARGRMQFTAAYVRLTRPEEGEPQ